MPETEEDRERLRLVAGMAGELYRRYGHQGRMAVTGGGALRLAYGIQRPTYDLDIDMTVVPADAVETLQKWCDRSNEWKGTKVDRKQQGRGYIRVLATKEKGAWRTKVDLAAGARAELEHGEPLREIAVEDTAVPVQPLTAIARRKMAKALGERREGRDLYDLVWLMAKHPEAFEGRQREYAARRITQELTGGDYNAWMEALRDDRAVQMGSAEDILEAAWNTAVNEPRIVLQEIGGGHAVVRGLSVERGTADIVVVDTHETKRAVIVEEGPLQKVCGELRRYGLEEEGKVLQIERTLEQSLAQARARRRDGE